MVAFIPLVAALLWVTPVFAGFDHSFNHDSIRSFRSLRYENVVSQTDWHTCGAAAVATWLTYYLDLPTTETDVLAIAAASMVERGQDPNLGLTLLSLREALQAFGITTVGYRVPAEALEEYFRAGGLPLLIHLTRPELHYVLAIGVIGGRLYVADPSFGRRLLSFRELAYDKGFSGVVLAAITDDMAAGIAAKNQGLALREMALRERQMHQLQAVMRR